MAKTYTVIYKNMKTRRELRPGVMEDLTYQISIDWGAVTKLALKAAGNKSGRSNMGPIRVEITKAKCGVGV